MHFISLLFVLLSSTVHHSGTSAKTQKILFVVSNVSYYGDSDIPSSNHFGELVIPYDILSQSGFDIDFVSPEGGAVPLGYINTSDSLIRQYIYDCDFMQQLSLTLKPSQVQGSQYSAIYYCGGGAAMFGIADNVDIQKIAMEIYGKNHGVISALCHGSIGIANLQNDDGSYLVAGKSISGFPDMFENSEAEYFKEFEFTVEGLLNKRNAHFTFSNQGWDGYYQVDGRLITGQDPSAAEHVAHQIINTLKPTSKD